VALDQRSERLLEGDDPPLGVGEGPPQRVDGGIERPGLGNGA
jgi:hypothetical protein